MQQNTDKQTIIITAQKQTVFLLSSLSNNSNTTGCMNSLSLSPTDYRLNNAIITCYKYL